jgi:hypothetical protein
VFKSMTLSGYFGFKRVTKGKHKTCVRKTHICDMSARGEPRCTGPTNDKSDGQLSDNKRAVGAYTPLISCWIFVVWFRGSTPYPHARIIEI